MKPALLQNLSEDMEIIIDEAGQFYSIDTVDSIMGYIQGMSLIRTVTHRYLDISKMNVYPATNELKTEFLLRGISFPKKSTKVTN
jgi:hypothetical protein